MLKIMQGDLFKSEADVIAHGCNTIGVMGKGIATEFRKRFPKMYDRYVIECKHPPERLWGTSLFWENPDGKPHVACLFTQNGFMAFPEYIEYSLMHLKGQIERNIGTGRLALPAIGCGVAKTPEMDFTRLKMICEKVFSTSSTLQNPELPPLEVWLYEPH